ncbi:hypothetical protein E2P81_ATG12061 [Venturia nashicola]|uniref:Uncharacterized protein n=1 Tax=Venturia nashicola TaxID=86259 RepID=A0A4Z1NTP8_9PEZI|nr:hypothetical protein E6O75_ATG11760 [Venturia nashicola]TLD24725.1 hypothetical protein E2P81_ATG12061 [Venturia nashicola]
MLPTLLLMAFSATQISAQIGRSCGFEISPCPADMVCEKINPACSRGENCAGTCQPGPYYNDVHPSTRTTEHSTAQRRGCGVPMIGGVYNCESDEKCIDDPSRPAGSCGMACDRPGICVNKNYPVKRASTTTTTALQIDRAPTICGGRQKEQPCKADEQCVDKPETPGALAYDGPGICVKKVFEEPAPPKYERICGYIALRPGEKSCRKDEICVDNPRRPKGTCGLECDGPGICVKPVFCGGLAGIKCKEGNKICVDDPRDKCDPQNGGVDCGGVCV